jgi:hypothetical protein
MVRIVFVAEGEGPKDIPADHVRYEAYGLVIEEAGQSMIVPWHRIHMVMSRTKPGASGSRG